MRLKSVIEMSAHLIKGLIPENGRYENKGDLDASINCFVRSVDMEIVQAGCIPNNSADLLR